MKVTGALADHLRSLIKQGSKISREHIKLTPSDFHGMPSSEPLRPSESTRPVVGRLMFNGSDELPPIVFYEIADWASPVEGADPTNRTICRRRTSGSNSSRNQIDKSSFSSHVFG